MTQKMEAITYRWDLSWGWKMQGVDTTSQVCLRLLECLHRLVRCQVKAGCARVLSANPGLSSDAEAWDPDDFCAVGALMASVKYTQ